ncbi:hypothetical protein HUN59_04600 [Curtobacterium sp. Csp2]|uniref:hypothetical protein n=1 Tax=Curtobacterium sp. Csp2 TaxID=2495430 RepID=UPI001580E907|nr:hypothetical protein [Curtobacterium sp. Csp2]QKS15591.1 hypothetical protein HUN59_04600 [Curtobacterium sp. Csp2]
MTLTRRSPATAAAYALSLIGRTRDALPVPWTDSRSIDDCARFCSHVLWGGFPISWVDNFKSAGDGSYGGGSTDLQPWDVLLFDWEGNGVGNHVEFMVADLGNGTVRTYGANGSDTRAAAYRIRPKRYIMGRFRPAWTTATPAGSTSGRPAGGTITNTLEDDMSKADVDALNKRIDNVEGLLTTIANAITDKRHGVIKFAQTAAETAQTVSRQVQNLDNSVNDRGHGAVVFAQRAAERADAAAKKLGV